MGRQALHAVCVAALIDGGVGVFDRAGMAERVGAPDPLVTDICLAATTCATHGSPHLAQAIRYKTGWLRPGLRLNFKS